jgi:sugar-specific transcriptional regulator TrmB
MSEQSNQPNNEQDKDVGAELQQELRELTRQLETAFRATLESERTKRIQADLAAGVRELSGQVRNAVENVAKDPRVQEAEERGRQAISQARESKVVQEVQDVLITGISQLNMQLRKLVERIEQEGKNVTNTQHVPVEQEPNTNETTKLDN